MGRADQRPIRTSTARLFFPASSVLPAIVNVLLLNPPNAPPQPFFNSFFLNSASGLDRFGPFHFSHCYPAISSFLFWANVIHAHLIFSPLAGRTMPVVDG